MILLNKNKFYMFFENRNNPHNSNTSQTILQNPINNNFLSNNFFNVPQQNFSNFSIYNNFFLQNRNNSIILRQKMNNNNIFTRNFQENESYFSNYFSRFQTNFTNLQNLTEESSNRVNNLWQNIINYQNENLKRREEYTNLLRNINTNQTEISNNMIKQLLELETLTRDTNHQVIQTLENLHNIVNDSLLYNNIWKIVFIFGSSIFFFYLFYSNYQFNDSLNRIEHQNINYFNQVIEDLNKKIDNNGFNNTLSGIISGFFLGALFKIKK